jgi:hypothetical protein
MDEKLAKGLTKQFFRNWDDITDKKINEITYLFLDNANSRHKKKLWTKIESRFKGPWNNFSTHFSIFGTKRKPRLGFVCLVEGDFNPREKWDEILLFSRRILITFNPFDINVSDDIDFWISHHALQRMFERNSNLKWDEFENSIETIRQELKFVLISKFIWNFLININGERVDPSIAHEVKDLSFAIPTLNGNLYGKLSKKNSMDIRTFIELGQLTTEQVKMRLSLIEAMEPYTNFFLPYTFDYVARTEVDDFELDFWISMIFRDLGPILQNIIPTMLSSSVSDYHRKLYYSHIEENLNELSDFVGIPNEEMDALTSKMKLSAKEGRVIEFSRGLKLNLTRIIQNQKNLNRPLKF